MEVNEKKYDDILQEIWSMRNHIYKRYGVDPNTVTMSYEDFKALKDTNEFLTNRTSDDEKLEVFGMKIIVGDTKETLVRFNLSV